MNLQRLGRGFTLLELLVVFVISGLIATLVLQGVTFLLGSYSRVATHQTRSVQELMLYSWYRNSIRNLVAGHDPDFFFSGSTTEMHGFTLQPVFGHSGMLTEIVWRIESDGDWLVLRYTENKNQPVEIHRWQADAAVFKYKGEQSGWIDAWPPDKDDANVLPKSIRLDTDRNEAPFHILSTVRLRLRSQSDYRDFLGDIQTSHPERPKDLALAVQLDPSVVRDPGRSG